MEEKLCLITDEKALKAALEEKKKVVAMSKKDFDLVKAFLTEKPKFKKVTGDGGFGPTCAARLVEIIAESLEVDKKAIGQLDIAYEQLGDVRIRILSEEGDEVKSMVKAFKDLSTRVKMAILTARTKSISLEDNKERTIQVITRRGEKVYLSTCNDIED